MIEIKTFLGNENIQDVYFIRKKVFLDEQNVPENLVYDVNDKDAVLLVAYDDGKPVATGRILNTSKGFKLGQIAVLKEERGKYYGDFIVRILIRKAFEMGGQSQYLNAQKHAVGFYEKLGFKPTGEEFVEGGIEHVAMVRDGDILGTC